MTNGLHVIAIESIQINDGTVAKGCRKLAGFVQNVGDPTRHTGSKVLAGFTEHDDQSFRHVLTTVIADAFREKRTETLTRRSIEVELDRVFGQPYGTVLLRDLPAQHRTYGPVNIL